MSFTWQRHGGDHWNSHGLALTALSGITTAQLEGRPTDVHFEIRRDAGTFVCDGRAGERHGGGLFELELEPAFAAELKRRGVGEPSESEQIRLALADAGYALLDALKRQRYETPTVSDLVRMAEHGVNVEYVTEMDRLGLRAETLAGLVMLRDHG